MGKDRKGSNPTRLINGQERIGRDGKGMEGKGWERFQSNKGL